ncbi:16S rRNA (adenine(1518)-N(6)/adenine(1519)-N(6))-dimethyltransferase RsmA [Akkermansia sp.]|uniref:16S rRNA (adenine(1518)-N(6)/adenine(1519)-N(6))- dimethyltransferase RsmA n=1 Tax=Akkermansia sp. TaxID=1872421 RepID=UPI003AB37F9E
MKPVEIRNVLEEHDVRPSKSLGQNFLTDENVARWIVDQLEIQPEDCVVEVGPGTGALTEHAAPLCRRMVLVEFDARLAEYQKNRWAGDPHVEVYHADGASWDPRGLFAEAPVKFLGNLPYSAGGAILQNFLSRPSPVERAVVMLQKEFIDRILATPEDDAFGLLSLRIQKNWIPRALKTIPPEAFHPRPRIDSTVMLLTPRPVRELPPYDDRLMDELMRKAFSQRRKQLKKQLPPSPPWDEVAASLGISPSARPEELNLAQWVDLARAYDSNPLKDVAQSGDELFDVVDELNQMTGTGTRREIHEMDLRHRAVHMFLVNKHGAVLLQKRSMRKDRQPGRWDSSAAGHLDAGEDYDQAAVRELEEELGVTGCELRRIADFDAGENNGWEFVALYEGRYTGRVRFPAAEVDSVQWFTPEQIQAWVERRPQDFSSAFIPCWNAWLAANKKALS